MNFNDKMIIICERRLYPYSPEYLNCLSALYISLISYYHIKKEQELNIQLIYSCIFLNGFSSFLYHWFAWYIFKLFDEFTMIIPIWIGLCYITNNLNYSYNILILITLINITLLVLDVFKFFENLFPLFFTIEMLSLIPLYKQSILKYKDINHKGIFGIIICICSGLIWGLVEIICNKYLLFGHSVWHIGMSTGLCYLIDYFKIANLIKFKKKYIK